MSNKETNNYVPERNNALGAFDAVKEQHFGIGKTIAEMMEKDRGMVSAAGVDYLYAGLKFLADDGYDDYLREVGTISWNWIKERMINFALTNDLAYSAKQLGFSGDGITNLDEPRLFIHHKKWGRKRNIIEQRLHLVTPVSFLITVQKQPIEALAILSKVGSELRDISNGMEMIDPNNLYARAEATQAHFLKEALVRHPNTGLSPKFWNSLTNYPDGINSLPPNVRYRGYTR